MLVVVSQANDTLVCEKETGVEGIVFSDACSRSLSQIPTSDFDHDATEKLRTYFSNVLLILKLNWLKWMANQIDPFVN